MNCIGHVFDERPYDVEQLGRGKRRWLGFTVPPRGSRLYSQYDDVSWAVDPDGFHWVRAGSDEWMPTGGLSDAPSIEHERNYVMRLR